MTPTTSNGWPPMRIVSPTGGMPPNSLRCDLGADERHAPAQAHVLVVEEAAARLRRLAAHRAVARPPRRGSDGSTACCRTRSGSRCMNSGLTFFTSGSSPIASTSSDRDADALAGALAAGLQARLPGKHDDGAVGERAREARRRARRGSRRRTPAARRPRRCPTRCRASTAPRGSGDGRGRRTASRTISRRGREAHRVITSRSEAPRPAAAPPRGAPDTWT